MSGGETQFRGRDSGVKLIPGINGGLFFLAAKVSYQELAVCISAQQLSLLSGAGQPVSRDLLGGADPAWLHPWGPVSAMSRCFQSRPLGALREQ